MSRTHEPSSATPDYVHWIDDQLALHRRRRVGDPRVHQARPWATVHVVPVEDGRVWFKACGATTRHEVVLYELFGRIGVDAYAPRALGVNTDQGWLLLEDAGPPIAELHASHADAIAGSLVEYGELQRLVAPHADALVSAGVPDMRPTRMLDRFDEALAVADVDARTHERLREHRPTFASWCEQLAASPIPASIDHNDLHPWNIITDGSTTRFYDWGDSVIAHPFATLLVPMGFITRALERDPNDPAVLAVIDTYIEAVTGRKDVSLRNDAIIACRVAKVARALGWHRALEVDGDSGTEFRAAVSETLASVLDQSFLGGA